MLILAAILAIFVYGMIAAMLGTILPDLSARFHLTPKQNGTIAFCQALGLIIASLAVGPLIDNEGKKVGMLLGLALITLALVLLPKSSGYATIATYLFLLGIGGGIIVTAANALASDVSPEHRGTTLNLLNLFFGLGGLATPFISANLLSRNAVRLCYLVAGLTFATLIVNIATTMPQPTGAQSFVFSEVGDVLGRPTLWLLALFLFLYVALGFALGLLIGRVGVSQVLKSVSSLTVTLAASILMVITTYLMSRTKDVTVAGGLVFLAGVAMAPVFPTTLAIVGDVFPRMTGTAMGIVITSGWIGLAVSSRIIGSIAGGDPKRLKKALLVLPVMAMIMIAVNITLQMAGAK